MKRLLPVFLAITILFSSFTVQTNKAHAFAWAGALAGAGTVAAGPYIIAGLIIAAGGAAIIGANDEDIQRKAKEIYAQTSDGFKSGLETAIAGATAAGKDTITLTESMKADLSLISDAATSWVGGMIHAKEYQNMTPGEGFEWTKLRQGDKGIRAQEGYILWTSAGYASSYHLNSRKYSTYWAINVYIFQLENRFDQTSISINPYYEKYPDPLLHDEIQAVTDLSALNSAGANIGYSVKVLPVDSTTPAPDVLAKHWDDSLNAINEIDLPLDEWLAQAKTNTGQKVNVDSTTGTMTLEDGTPYDGPIEFPSTIPTYVPGTDVTVQNPTVPVEDVLAPEAPPVTGDGILQGLWDWLKGILQAILDALQGIWQWIKDILSALLQMLAHLASMLGILTIAQSIADVLTNIWEWIRNRPPPSEPGKPTSPLPLAILLALFDLLVSIIFYLVRMLEFVLKIPIIPSKPIDNPAFAWFREAKIMGVYIYQVVSSMATIGLSFLVYKAIRKVMP